MTATTDFGGADTAPAVTPVRFTVYADGEDMLRAVTRRVRELCRPWAVMPEVEAVDVRRDPQAAEKHNIVGIPTVVREAPPPRRRVIGMLDDDRRCAEALGLDTYPREEAAG